MDAEMGGAARRLAELLAAYSAQGDHLTGTDADARSGTWLRELLAEAAQPAKDVTVRLRPYEMVPGRLDNDTCVVTLADGSRLQGRAIHNSASYADVGEAPLHEWREEAADDPGSEAAVAEPAIAVIFAEQGDPRFEIGRPNLLNDLRRSGKCRAYLFVYQLRALPGSEQIAMMNADPYDPPFGCLAVQLPPSCTERLRAACAAGEPARISCQAAFVPASSANVLASVEGAEPVLPPVVVMTPRSGWGPCASERGPGLACLVEAMRAVAGAERPLRRTVIFSANSGHELGHLGLERFLGEVEHDVFVWVHLGANFGSRLPPEFPVFYQASDAPLEQLLLGSLGAAGLEKAAPMTKVGDRPVGEVREIYDRGGRYVSLMGLNPRFHHPTDTYPEAVDVDKTLMASRAVAQAVLSLAGMAASDLPVPEAVRSDL